MDAYDPMSAPDPEAWLALDEQERIALVRAYHESERVEPGNAAFHAIAHTVVENQLAMNVEQVQVALDRLMAEGLDRHDALHAVGSVLAEHIWGTVKGKPGKQLSPESYYRALKKLTAKTWQATR